jgi:hypothetical protein
MYPCTHYAVETVEADSPAATLGLGTPGIRVELSPGGRVLRLPEDGERIYVMNARGDTIQSLQVTTHKTEPVEGVSNG